MLKLVLWALWSLAALMPEEIASAAFLPPSIEKMIQDFDNLIDERQGTLAKDEFNTPVDISKLPANYHNEEKLQRKLGNATMFSHHEINKMTDNRTGDVMFSEKTETSIEVLDKDSSDEKISSTNAKENIKTIQTSEENLPQPQQPDESNLQETRTAIIQEEISAYTKMPRLGFRFFNLSLPVNKPRLTFLIFRLPLQPKREQELESNWAKDESVSDRKNRLLAIRNGLLAVPHPIKKMALLTVPSHRLVPRKHHFSFLWRKI